MDTQNSATQESERPIQQFVTAQPPHENKVNLNKISSSIVGIFFVIALVFGGYFFLTNKQTRQQVNIAPIQSPTSTPRTSPTSQSQPDEFVGWKTHINTEGGYSIQYPADLIVDTSFAISPYNKISINIPVSAFRIEFFDNPNSLSAKDFFQDRSNKQLQSAGPPPREPKSSKNVSINGKNAYQIETFAFDGNERITYLTKDNKAVVITYYSFNTDPSFNQQNVKLCDQILSTFKFTNKNQQAGTSNWTEYTSSDGLFSFQYPKNDGWDVVENENTSIGNKKQIVISSNQTNPANGSIDLVQIYPIIYSSFDEYLKNNTFETDITETQFNGIPAIKSVQSGSEQAGGSFIDIFFVYNGQGYLVNQRFWGLLRKDKLFDFPKPEPDIVSTIKLLK